MQGITDPMVLQGVRVSRDRYRGQGIREVGYWGVGYKGVGGYTLPPERQKRILLECLNVLFFV